MKNLKNYIDKHYSPTSAPGYFTMIVRYLSWSGEEKAEKATYSDVLEYIGYLRKKGLHPKTLRNNLFAVKIYYRYLLSEGKRQDHPCQKLYLKDKINRAIDVESLYPEKVLEDLFKNHKSPRKEHQKRDEVIISLLIYQGLTALEITQIKVKDIDLNKGTIRIKGNVKNKGRTVDLKPGQIMLFYTYLKEDRKHFLKDTSEALFLLSQEGMRLHPSSINQIINYGKAKYERITPMKIRQSVIAQLVKNGNDIRVVQVFAGHRRAGSTEAYKQTGLEELKNMVQKVHPLDNQKL